MPLTEIITAAAIGASSLATLGNASRLRRCHTPTVVRPAPADTVPGPLVRTRS